MGSDKNSIKSSSSGSSGEVKRETWGNHIEFMLSCIGYAVGLGNVWRFPYLCFRNGGGAFLVPYLLALLLAGLPLFFMEISMGQYSGLGVLTIWKLAPVFKGLGWGMLMTSFLTCIYYNVIIAWCVYMFAASLTTELPWTTCDNAWNTERCTVTRIELNETMKNVTRVSPSLEYWENEVLQLSDGADDIGHINWAMALSLVFAWILVFFSLIKGVQSVGKVVYFTATFPYIMLTALLIRGVTLPGSYDGIMFYINPKWELLTQSKVWGDAATQIFYSLGTGWGGLMTMSSFNKFKNNCMRDSVIIALINCGSSIFAGFAVFSTLGFMSYITQTDIQDIATSGPGLIFVVYPEAISRMPIAPLWSCLFFFMIITLGLDSQFTMLETCIAGIVDEWPKQLRPYKVWITLSMCIAMFIIGLLLVSQGGIYWLTLMDWYIAIIGLMVICFIEVLVISYVYGFRRFSNDIKLMTGRKPFIYWLAMWLAITPLLLIAIVVFVFIAYSPVTYGSYVYPPWCEIVGWVIGILPVAVIPLMALIKCAQVLCSKNKTWKSLITPESDWDDRSLEYREMKKGDIMNMGELGMQNNGFDDAEMTHM